MRRALALAWLLALAAVQVACARGDTPSPDGSKSTAAKSVLREDVRKTCEYRMRWRDRLRKKCATCMALAAMPRCGCKADTKEYSGLCADEKNKKDADKSCGDAYQCSYKCKPTDCDCMARCFEGRDDCHDLAVAFDGCVADVCDPFCRGDGA